METMKGKICLVTGKYFIDKQEQKSNAESYDTAVAQRLWQVSEELTGLA